MAKKASLGRQKIAMAKISKKNHLQVTFSKRRSGLFKKASELCTLCGVEIAIVVFSPANKVFSFGHPEVDSIINRFLTHDCPPDPDANQLLEAHRSANIRELNIVLAQVMDQLEAERKRGEELDQRQKQSRNQCWWESPVEELGLYELQRLGSSLEELKENVIKHTNKLLVMNPTSYFDHQGTDFDPFQNKALEPNHASSSSFSQIFNFHNDNGFS